MYRNYLLKTETGSIVADLHFDPDPHPVGKSNAVPRVSGSGCEKLYQKVSEPT